MLYQAVGSSIYALPNCWVEHPPSTKLFGRAIFDGNLRWFSWILLLMNYLHHPVFWTRPWNLLRFPSLRRRSCITYQVPFMLLPFWPIRCEKCRGQCHRMFHPPNSWWFRQLSTFLKFHNHYQCSYYMFFLKACDHRLTQLRLVWLDLHLASIGAERWLGYNLIQSMFLSKAASCLMLLDTLGFFSNISTSESVA